MSNEVYSPWDALDTIGNIAAWGRDNCGDTTNQTQKYMDDIIMFVNAARALPRRNCDVGTEKEQEDRFDKYCRGSNYCAVCPIKKLWDFQDGPRPSCTILWSQMPYEEGDAE